MSAGLAFARRALSLSRSVAAPTEAVLDLPTFDGDLNITHPTVVTFPEGFGGYRYWMAYTPFPDEAREDPHVVASNDNVRWEVPAGANLCIYTRAEAIAAFGAGAFNSDTELVKMPDGRLALYWRVSGERIVRKVTSDGRTWGSIETLITNASGFNSRLVSPSIVIGPDGTWRMWTINSDDPLAREIELRTSADGVTWGAATECTLPTDTDINPWHIAVKRADGAYHLLVNGDPGRGAAANFGNKLYYWTSTDGLAWIGSSDPVLPVSDGYERFYRSSFEPTLGQPLKWNLYLANVKEAGGDDWRISVHKGVDLNFGHLGVVRDTLDRLVAYKDFLRIPAEVMRASGTTHALAGSFTPVLSFPASGYNWGHVTVRPPDEWNTFQVRLLWANAGTGTGDVKWLVQRTFYRVGDALSGGGFSASVNFIITAGAQNVVVRSSWSSALSANDSGSGDPGSQPNVFAFGVQRRAGDAEDTLADAALLIGVELRRVT